MKKPFAEISAVSLLMLVVALVATWPLADHFFSAIPCKSTAGRLYLNQPGDQLQLMYWFWLFRDNLFGGNGLSFMQNPYEFNMAAAHPPDGLSMYPLYFLHMLFSPLGDIAAYNVLILLSYVLTGLFTYLLVKQYTGSRAGALLGALIYTLVPIRIINMMGGHLNGFIYYLLPATLYFLDRAVIKKSVVSAIFCGLAIFWLSLLEVHLIYYLCVFLGCYIPFRLLFFPETGLEESPEWLPTFHEDGPGGKWWPVLILVITAISLTIFYQGMSSLMYHHGLLTTDFWIILCFYPFLLLSFALLISLLLANGFNLSLQSSVRVVALIALPFNLLPFYVLNFSLKSGVLNVILSGLLLFLVPFASWQAWKRYGSSGDMQFHLVKRWFSLQSLLRISPIFVGLLFSVGWVLMVKKLFFAGSVAHGGRTIQDVKLFSPRLHDLYMQGSDVYLGIVPLLLVLYCLVLLVRQTVYRERRWTGRQLVVVSFYLFIFFLAYLLGAGLSFGSSSLYILFFDYFPFFNYPRVPDRIMTIAFLAGAILSGFAIRDLQQLQAERGGKWIGLVFFPLLVALLWYDFGAGKPIGLTNLDRGQTIYSYIKKNIDDELLLEIPLWPGDSHQSSLYEYYITLDKIRRVNGYTPIVTQEYINTVYKPLATLNMGLLDRQQFGQLKKMGVRFITVHDNPDVFPRKVSPFPPHITVRRLMNSPFLEYVQINNKMSLPGLERENNKLYLFKLVDQVPDMSSGMQRSTCRFFIPNAYHASALPHITGQLVQDTTIQQQVLKATAGQDKSHYLSYGPYEELPAGHYQVYFRLRTDKLGNESAITRLDVSTYVNHEEQVILNQKEIKWQDFQGTGYQDFTLDFSVSEFRKVEFRTWFHGNSDLWLEKIVLTCADQGGFDSSYEAESLLGNTGFLVHDKDASSGKAVMAKVVSDSAGRMIYGPNRRYPAGKYRVTYFLKSGSAELLDPIKKTVAVLSVTTDENKTVLASRKVGFKEVSRGQYKAIPVDMILNRNNEVSFNVFFNRQVNILVDRIEIEYLGKADGQALPFLILLRDKHAAQSTATGK